jgi:hypothetical protein
VTRVDLFLGSWRNQRRVGPLGRLSFDAREPQAPAALFAHGSSAAARMAEFFAVRVAAITDLWCELGT